VLLATGMNIVWGVAGQISLGQSGLYAIGAYTSGILAVKLSMPLPVAIIAAMVVGGLAALVVSMPALRVRGFYLGMVTLGFGMLVQTLMTEWASLTGGVQGLENIPSPTLRTLTIAGWQIRLTAYYYIAAACAVLGVLVARNLMHSYWGRAMAAVRESEIAASAQGVFVGKTKVAAFAVAGVYTALAGALYAHLTAYVSPEVFGVDTAVLIMIMPLVGGLGTLAGPVVGAGVFLALPELLQNLWQYNLLIYGLILVASFTLFPQGIVGTVRRWRRASPDVTAASAITAKPVIATATSGETVPLRASRIGMEFGGLTALADVDLELHSGRVQALIGPNGSGKSTFVNVLTRVYQPTSGTVAVAGRSVDGLRPDQVARAGLARTFQNLRLFGDLTVMDNVLIGAHPQFRSPLWTCLLSAPGSRREEARERGRAGALLRQFCSPQQVTARAADLPYGSQKLIELARAVAKAPRVLLLDEPAAGLSAEEIEILRRVIRDCAGSGAAVLVIEHNMDFVMSMSDTITVLDQGQKICEGAPRVVQADARVIEAYLGTTKVFADA
jgi:ABC-type branched-subunit amino acid transport system ATPase component/ABC-type branched-subunit amino acid transport system permease subunit